MTDPRHSPTRPHYLRFAIVLAGLSGCTTSTTVSDAGSPPLDASPSPDAYVSTDTGVVPNDCYLTPSPEPIGSWGDGGCYYLDGGGRASCPPSCRGGFDAIVGPLSPPDLPA